MSTCYDVSKLIVEDGERAWECVADSTKRPEEYMDAEGTFLVESEEGVACDYVVNSPVVAVLSSPLTFGSGIFKSQEVEFPSDLKGIQHYVGHPATRGLLDALGAEYTPGRWVGPQVGESYIAVPLAQNSRDGGWTKDQAIESTAQLSAILITRLA